MCFFDLIVYVCVCFLCNSACLCVLFYVIECVFVCFLCHSVYV